MLAAVAMCIQFRSYLCGAKFTLRTDHKSLVWLHRFKDTEGMMARGFMLCNNFIFRSYTGRVMTMDMLTDSPGPCIAVPTVHQTGLPTGHLASCQY